MLVVEVQDRDGGRWWEVSRYLEPDGLYVSSRHVPPSTLTGREIAEEDRRRFESPTGYGRPARVREVEDGMEPS